MKRFVLGVFAVLALAASLGGYAHTTVQSAKPPNGAELDRSPPTIELKFKHPVQMTSIVVLAADKSERKLPFKPAASTALITIDDPGLNVGRNEIRWKALSKDGHVIDGKLIYIIKPASASP
jgi:methionine-rich copper-binding protein CopC